MDGQQACKREWPRWSTLLGSDGPRESNVEESGRQPMHHGLGTRRLTSSWDGMTRMRSAAEIGRLEFLGDVDDFRERLGATFY
jgi:hypothetical protein